jgi:transcriptional regulator with XRE-family HTH domain
MGEPACDLISYTELADLLEQLPLLVREARRARRLTMHQAAEQIGVAASTVMRLEHGEGGDRAVAVLVLRWLDRSGSPEPAPDQPEQWITTDRVRNPRLPRREAER